MLEKTEKTQNKAEDALLILRESDWFSPSLRLAVIATHNLHRSTNKCQIVYMIIA